MPRLSQKPTVAALLASLSRRLARARLHYGHGTGSARDDAAALIWHVLGLPPDADGPRVRRRTLNVAQQQALGRLTARRIDERVPVVYLTRQCWYAGLPIYVDERVLIPRSPIAELIEQRFEPWVDTRKVRRILDMGTGSGCIAVACARAFARARVTASDISAPALAVARINIGRLDLARRVQLCRSDHFSALAAKTYDIIVSNPPYVGRRELARLPAEYRHEPRLALAAGDDGLASVRVLLQQARRHLNPGGILVVEVGNAERALRRAYPRLPFVWLQFRRGGGGVFLLAREQLSSGAVKR